MSLGPLSSLIEILAVFNIALVVSSSFLRDLNVNLTGNLGDCKRQIEILRDLIKNNRSFIISNIDSSDLYFDFFQEKLKTLNGLEKEVDEAEDQVLSSIDHHSQSSTFQRYCLFAAMISIYLLLIIGFSDFRFKDDFQGFEEGLFFLNFFGAIAFYFLNKKFQSFITVSFAPLIGAAMAFVVYFVCDLSTLNLHFPFDFGLISIISSLLVISGHFIYAFLRAFFTSSNRGKAELKTLKDLKDRLEEHAKVTSGSLDAVLSVFKQADIDS